MRRLVSLGAVIAIVANVSAADGQPKQPARGAEAEDDDDLDLEPSKTSPKAAEPPSRTADELPAPPPPPDPRPDEQSPRPVFGALGSDPARHVEFGPDVGVWSRSAKGDTVEYSPGFAYGAHARVELLSFLGFRAYVNQAHHSVDVPKGELGLAGTSVDQPSLDVMQIGARLEPTWMPHENVRLWLGLGVAWGRLIAPAPSSSGSTELQVPPERSGVFLEWSGALGVTWDAVPRWLALTASAAGGVMTNQTGSAFQDRQAIDQNGQRVELGELPEFDSSFSALIGIGMIR